MDGYMTRFVRKDGKPDEEYYYQNKQDADNHLKLFKDDDSDLYAYIEVINCLTGECSNILRF